MAHGCQQCCHPHPEFTLLLCVTPPKVHDSSIWLNPGVSAVFAIQCGDPAAKPPHLQPEKQRCEGSSEEDADQEIQADLVAQVLLLHRGWGGEM